MKFLLVYCAFAAVALAEEYYDSKYDDFDAESLVENPRLLKGYGKCFLNKGPCTPEGENFKKVIPEAIKTKCGKCSPKQRPLVRTVIKGFQKELPELWDEIINHFDEKHEYEKDFYEFINASD